MSIRDKCVIISEIILKELSIMNHRKYDEKKNLKKYFQEYKEKKKKIM